MRYDNPGRRKTMPFLLSVYAVAVGILAAASVRLAAVAGGGALVSEEVHVLWAKVGLEERLDARALKCGGSRLQARCVRSVHGNAGEPSAPPLELRRAELRAH